MTRSDKLEFSDINPCGRKGIYILSHSCNAAIYRMDRKVNISRCVSNISPNSLINQNLSGAKGRVACARSSPGQFLQCVGGSKPPPYIYFNHFPKENTAILNSQFFILHSHRRTINTNLSGCKSPGSGLRCRGKRFTCFYSAFLEASFLVSQSFPSTKRETMKLTT